MNRYNKQFAYAQRIIKKIMDEYNIDGDEISPNWVANLAYTLGLRLTSEEIIILSDEAK